MCGRFRPLPYDTYKRTHRIAPTALTYGDLPLSYRSGLCSPHRTALTLQKPVSRDTAADCAPLLSALRQFVGNRNIVTVFQLFKQSHDQCLLAEFELVFRRIRIVHRDPRPKKFGHWLGDGFFRARLEAQGDLGISNRSP